MGNTWASVKRKDEAGPQQTVALPGCVGAAGPLASPGGHPGRLPSSISTSAAFPLQGEAGPQGDQGREGPIGIPGDPVGSPAAGGQGGSCCRFGSAHRFRGRSLGGGPFSLPTWGASCRGKAWRPWDVWGRVGGQGGWCRLVSWAQCSQGSPVSGWAPARVQP